MSLTICPITFREACEFVAQHHRHHKPPRGHKFSIACQKNGEIVGVAMVGRPVARMLQDGFTIEVNRLCTLGEKNVCSKLYGVAARVAKELGYKRILTYILGTETGSSLKAAGWDKTIETKGGSWDRKPRRREDNHPLEKKLRFEKQL